MDETPEELEEIRKEAAQIDLYRYQRRRRAVYAIFAGAAAAGAVWLVLEMVQSQRNPCQRVHDHVCAEDPGSLNCKTYKGILRESVEDESEKMRQNIRHQCQRKIERLKEDGVEVP